MLCHQDRLILRSSRNLAKRLQANVLLEHLHEEELYILLVVESMTKRATKSTLQSLAQSVQVESTELNLLISSATKARNKGIFDIPKHL